MKKPPTKQARQTGQSIELGFEERLNLQAIEDNPLDAEQIAMFRMFDREGWSHDQRRQYILDRARKAAASQSGK